MPSYIFYSLMAAVGFAAASILNKLTSKHAIAERWPLLFWNYLAFAPFAAIVPFIAAISIPNSMAEWLFIIGYSLFFLAGNICFFTAIFRVDASVFAPFMQLQAAFLAILAFLFLGERFPLANYLWIGVLILGAILVSADDKSKISLPASQRRQALLLVILAQLLFAGSNLFSGLLVKSMDFWNVMWWTYLMSVPMVLTLAKKVNRFDELKITFRQLRPLLAVNAGTFIGAASLFRAFQDNVTISATIGLLTGPIIFVFAVVASKINPEFLEHHARRIYLIRAGGVLITLVAAVMLSLN